jgi:hypothetical protein
LIGIVVALTVSGCGSSVDVAAVNETSSIDTTSWSTPLERRTGSTADTWADGFEQEYIDSYLDIAREGKVKHWLALTSAEKVEVARLWLVGKESRYPHVRPRQMLAVVNSMARIYGKNSSLSKPLSGAAEAVQSNYLYNKRRKAIQSGAVLGLTKGQLHDLIGEPQEIDSSNPESWIYRVGDVGYRLVFKDQTVADKQRTSSE